MFCKKSALLKVKSWPYLTNGRSTVGENTNKAWHHEQNPAVLSHFDEVQLTNQGKKTNADIVGKLTGVKNCDAHIEQIEEICKQVLHRNYPDMRERVSKINNGDTVSGSTNFITFLEKFESDDIKWISKLSTYFAKGE